MRRRAFLAGLTTAGLTTAGGLAASGCAGGLSSGLSMGDGAGAVGQAALSQADLRAVMGRLDRGLVSVARLDSMFEVLLPAESLRGLTPSQLRYMERADPAIKRATRALIAAGARGELPRGPLPQPFVERVAELSPELDHSVAEVVSLYEGISPRGKRRVGRFLHAEPGFPMDVTESLDGLAGHVGLAQSSRYKLRSAAREVSFRMSKQSAAGFMDESASRVRRIVGHHGLNAVFARQLVTHSTSAAIFRLMDEPAPSGGSAGMAPPPDEEVQPVPVGPAPQPVQSVVAPPPEEEGGEGDGALIAGGIILGVGAVVLGITIAGLAAGGDIGWAFGITAGALVAIGGIITLIVGAVLNA